MRDLLLAHLKVGLLLLLRFIDCHQLFLHLLNVVFKSEHSKNLLDQFLIEISDLLGSLKLMRLHTDIFKDDLKLLLQVLFLRW